MENQNRELILRRAREVFTKFGFRKTTLDDIANAVGKGKSALYYYFRNKEEIFEEVLEMEVARIKKAFLDAINSVKTPQQKLRIYIIRRMELFRELLDFYPSMRYEFVEYHSYIEKIRAKYDTEELRIISEILQQGVQEKIFVIPDIRLTAQAIITAMKGFEFPWAFQEDMKKMEKDIDSMLQVLFYGLLKRK